MLSFYNAPLSPPRNTLRADMHYTFKRILKLFVPNQIRDVDRTHMNIHASSPSLQHFPDGEQGKDNLGAYMRE